MSKYTYTEKDIVPHELNGTNLLHADSAKTANIIGWIPKYLLWIAVDNKTGKRVEVARYQIGRGIWVIEGSCGCDRLYGKFCKSHKHLKEKFGMDIIKISEMEK